MPTRQDLRADPAARRIKQTQEHAHLERLREVSKRFNAAVSAFATAEAERTQAVHDAHQTGLSIRTIAHALGLSRTRVHQLLQQEV
jgi:hypothetical protein